VILVNVNELATTSHSKFGNGIIKEGESEAVRIWIEVCNENAGRSILPFNGMQPGDAWLWAKFREDEKLQQKFKEFTEKKFDRQRGYYGKIGDRTVIKNSRIIKDAWIGNDAYIKGANKLKNLTINSSAEARTQIGEGVELVNGIIGFGCRIFYGVKAVRFFLSSNSQLKYGARLINSYLGDNSTISCCEVLNSLIFPAHEQHHNNSFLCAALVMGQSNMAAGATIGSNHNSRGADGELVAGRGFWPGLCVSLKHNSKFATFTLIAKGDFPAELNITLPFSLVSNDVTNDRLVVMPAYWFMYNMYALARNAGKYQDRDKRTDKTQLLEYDFLAPDSINEVILGMRELEKATAAAWKRKHHSPISLTKVQQLLDARSPELEGLEIIAEGMENSGRKTLLVKAPEAYVIYKDLVIYYGICQLLNWAERNKINGYTELIKSMTSDPVREEWTNVGGQLIPTPALKNLLRRINQGKVQSWEEVHEFYRAQSARYEQDKTLHAFASMLEVLKLTPKGLSRKIVASLLQRATRTRESIAKGIYESRAKDYDNPFRKMVYESEKEMEKVLGKLKDNSFIVQQTAELNQFKKRVQKFTRSLTLEAV
jgi:hypothetical protein